MLKKTLSLILATALACSAGSALALNYSGSQGNEATFELLEEARVSAPAAVQHLELNESKTFVSFPVLDGIPEDTVYVYRSANLYGGRAAGRSSALPRGTSCSRIRSRRKDSAKSRRACSSTASTPGRTNSGRAFLRFPAVRAWACVAATRWKTAGSARSPI